MKGNINRELTIRLQKDDVEAFNLLYWNYHSAIYYNILKLAHDSIVAEDIVQEVFIALWENRHKLDPEQEISGWLFVVSHNKSVSYLKRELKESLDQIELPQFLEDTEDIKDDLINARVSILEDAIEQLSPQKRKVFELCKLKRKTYEEVSKELNLSKYTVKEYLSDAVASIKKYIKLHSE
jgi:RNA polymerase sigma-70 factor (family 1)